ncbi:MAG: hypothetical protein ACE1ZH_06330, partial [Gammaproteobacteria bacterium]
LIFYSSILVRREAEKGLREQGSTFSWQALLLYGVWIAALYFSLPKMSIIWYGAQNSPYRGCRHTPGRNSNLICGETYRGRSVFCGNRC